MTEQTPTRSEAPRESTAGGSTTLDTTTAGSSAVGKPAPAKNRRLSREQLGLLVGLPILVAVILGAWLIWRLTAKLGDIESRQLAWSTLGNLTWQHLVLTFICTVVVLCTAIPIGIALTRPRLRRFAPIVNAIANAGQAAPVIGLIVLLAIWIGFGTPTAVLALSLYAFLPVLRNTITGLEGVNPNLVEAGRGMGMSPFGVLTRIELPMAVPVIMAGVRTALVLLVGTATFATFINAGGLGALITTGINLFRYSILISGALLVGCLALLVDWLGRVLEMLTRPKGL